MKLTFLGTASCFPTPSRGVSCIALTLDEGSIWLFDCGEGSQIQLQKCPNLRAGKVKKIFITHLHGDHLFGLPGLLCTLGNGCDANNEKIVCIYGPYGLRKYLLTSLEISRSIPNLKFSIHEMVPNENQFPPDWCEWNTDFEYSGQSASRLGESSYTKIYSTQHSYDSFTTGSRTNEGNEYENKGRTGQTKGIMYWDLSDSIESSYCVKAGALKHRIPSFGFVIKEFDKPGKLNAAKLQQDFDLKSGPIFGQIKSGKVIVLENGMKIDCDKYLGPSVKGRKISIFGDTCDSSELECLSQNSDLLVHESTMENSLSAKAIEYGHSTPEMAANFAHRSGAKRLCLTHVSPRYKPQPKNGDIETKNESQKDLEQSQTSDILKKEAEQYLRDIKCDMEVIMADDFLIVPVLKCN